MAETWECLVQIFCAGVGFAVRRDGDVNHIHGRGAPEFVLRMARDLKAAGANVAGSTGHSAGAAMGAGFAGCDYEFATVPVVILSPASVKSTNVEDEVSFARDERHKIIPGIYCDCSIPFQLRSFPVCGLSS